MLYLVPSFTIMSFPCVFSLYLLTSDNFFTPGTVYHNLVTSRLRSISAPIQGRKSYWIFKLPVHLFDHVLHTLKFPKHCILVQLIAKTKQPTGLPNAFIIILAIHVRSHLGRSNEESAHAKVRHVHITI